MLRERHRLVSEAYESGLPQAQPVGAAQAAVRRPTDGADLSVREWRALGRQLGRRSK